VIQISTAHTATGFPAICATTHFVGGGANDGRRGGVLGVRKCFQSQEFDMSYGPLGCGNGSGIAGASQLAQYGASPVVEISQIDQRLRNLELVNEEFRSLVSGLQVRFQNVLTPQMKNDAGIGKETPRPVVSPLADKLDEITGGLNHSAALIRDILDRVAL
jgi:hypothetical protein